MNVRNASRALVGADTALRGGAGDVALDDGLVESDRRTWSAITPSRPLSNGGISLVRRNT